MAVSHADYIVVINNALFEPQFSKDENGKIQRIHINCVNFCEYTNRDDTY